jgi:hypothetical protein
VILYRCFAWQADAQANGADSPLWFPRQYQGEGRHDNPEVYGCLYLADRARSSIVEQLAAFRGQRLTSSLLTRRGLPLALARLELTDDAALLDLDDPRVLDRVGLRPSIVATKDRAITQPQALRLFRKHPRIVGLRWWSAWEAQWANVTLFDRAAPLLRLVDVDALSLRHPALLDAAAWFGLRTV